jgi:hypothetical protein
MPSISALRVLARQKRISPCFISFCRSVGIAPPSQE